MNLSENPFFSIVIPTFNSEKFLGEALDSILAQTFQGFEVFIVDGPSIDRTQAIAEEYHAKDPRISYMRQTGKGPAQARNQGLEHARGAFVSFFDSDNLFSPDTLEAVKKKIDGGDTADVFYGDIRYFNNGHPEQLTKFLLHAPQVTLAELVKHNFMNLLGTFIKRDMLLRFGAFDNRFRTSEEHILWLRLVLWEHAKFSYIDSVLGKLRFHGENLTWRPSYFVEAAETNFVIYDWLEEEFKKNLSPAEQAPLLATIREERGRWLFRAGLGGLIMKDRSLAKKYFSAWADFTGRPAALRRLMDAGVTVAPLSLLSPALSGIRRRVVMRKYVPA